MGLFLAECHISSHKPVVDPDPTVRLWCIMCVYHGVRDLLISTVFL